MEYTRSLEGVHRESTRTLWSPHGVHSYPWGSVTYSHFVLNIMIADVLPTIYREDYFTC
jgi:hypothetical protein